MVETVKFGLIPARMAGIVKTMGPPRGTSKVEAFAAEWVAAVTIVGTEAMPATRKDSGGGGGSSAWSDRSFCSGSSMLWARCPYLRRCKTE